jgi:hypothetical protein
VTRQAKVVRERYFYLETAEISLQHEALHYHAPILQAHAFEGKEQY